MNVLGPDELKGEDGLLLVFNGAFNSHAELNVCLEPFLQALEANAGDWMPAVIEGKRRRKYTRTAIWKSLEERRDENSTHLSLYRDEWPALDMSLWILLPPLTSQLRVWLDIQPLSFFADAERCRRFVDMVRAWAMHYPVPHAAAHSAGDRELAHSPHFGRDEEVARRDGFDKIYEMFWLNVFGPRLVEAVGRERMLSTPAHRVEELPDGSVLVVTWPTAADFASEAAREAQARVWLHLRPDLEPSTVRRTLRERSAALIPVQPHFHPDVAPLVSRVVDRAPFHERQRQISQFNDWQPPEPREWLAADAVLSADMDPERALALYSRLAENLVALLHTKVPSVFEATPESLPAIDFQLWQEDFPSVFERQKIDELAVPAIGAYLGQVLVRHLGGTWIPRDKLMETQVLVGNRVWLPFARAWQYMRSRQSLLDCSLTQFYHVARRHRA